MRRQPETPSTSGLSTILVSPEEILPLPHAERRVTGGRGRSKRIPIVLTATPEKKKLEAAQGFQVTTITNRISQPLFTRESDSGKLIQHFFEYAL